jgi:hypothetical protein
MKHDVVTAMCEAAVAAAQTNPSATDTAITRAAYARGVRDMAALVHACVKVADEFANTHSNDIGVSIAFKGYAKSLRCIVSAADNLIPLGWE